ncbi:integrase, catalytic region, zinc finger, CCHC-type containing protein, partial [Tanacetum coccineum]
MACTPQQNGVVERRNRTLVEAAWTMLIFSKSLPFLWAKAAVTSVYPPIKNDWDLLFQPMFDEYFKTLSVVSTPISVATLLPSDTTRASSSSSTSIDKDAPSSKFDSDTFTNPFAPPDTNSVESSSRII